MRKRLRNAVTLIRDGRLRPPYRAPFDIVMTDRTVSLRRYAGALPTPGQRPVLLVPPLMVTSEIYDISPELSAVAFLTRHGVPTYVADFGAPEAQEGGLDRTLDDHVLAVSRCIDYLVARDGHRGPDVHLVGYSQGGMFCYQTAAYRKSAGIASLVTFGAPVDIRRNVPFKLNDKVAEKLIIGMRRLIGRPLAGLRGLPGTLSSRGFKLMAPIQELRHLVQLFGVLHDEEALARIEPKRRFLGGEGFTAWPGPALRTFIDEFVVNNRMKSGGMVIAGRTVALADITGPICYVLGEDDDLALPDAVSAIRTAASRAQTYPVHVRAGHFGLVVGRAAMTVCWPTVLAWTAWHDGRGVRPEILDSAADASPTLAADLASPARAVLAGGADALWERMGTVGVALGRAADTVRWQLPRVARRALLDLVGSAGGDAHVSLSRSLRERARETPEAVCFLFAGRAYTFGDADRRVDVIARALLAAGVGVGRRVAVLAHPHPDALVAVMALNRLGAVAVPIDPAWFGSARVAATLAKSEASLVIVDALRAEAMRAAFTGPIATIGRGASDAGDVIDLEAPSAVSDALEVPRVDPGRISDPALLFYGPNDAVHEVSNRDWALAGLDLAIDARLTTADTVYCPASLHVAPLALGLAGALVGGARLQLGDSPAAVPGIWDELMNSGATVVLADEEIARALADAPLPERHPVRLVLGEHLASEIAAALIDRLRALGTRTRYRPLKELLH